ncbi:MAG: HAD-IA family hydrolase [Spirochaetia bacterium]|nr:HAD-IA family hydrolase [Spirochaetia bacterium]
MKLVLFDLMDTVLVNPYYRVVSKLTPSHVTLHEFQSMRNMKSFLLFEKGEISERDFYKNYYKADFDFKKAGFPDPRKLKKYLYKKMEAIPGMFEIIRNLNQREEVQTGIASNYSIWYLEIFKKCRELETLFDYIFFSCEMGIRKPDSGFYRIIQESLENQKYEKIIFIDDRKENVDSASELGWNSFLFNETAELKEFLSESTGFDY